MVGVDILETILGEGSTPSYFPKKALDFEGDSRIQYGRGGKGRARRRGEDKMEKKEEAEKIRLEGRG